jgi:hypothetical protein
LAFSVTASVGGDDGGDLIGKAVLDVVVIGGVEATAEITYRHVTCCC